ncbi:MAG: hypothetical protein DCF32_09230 [Leptolyngbya sp.]|nr:MAG: hypothetical protein DCF32_09230 [Leptolyngbya sp.]
MASAGIPLWFNLHDKGDKFHSVLALKALKIESRDTLRPIEQRFLPQAKTLVQRGVGNRR